ncbi:MAG: ABC transporter ATP-binding protein [Bacteroidales bacterium]|nr:ABC transporter ATP-binding protein [Bacteroidales bacterium]
MPEIKLVNISKHFCHDLNLTIKDKEILVVVGNTGSGKTTLLNAISGVTHYKGNVYIDNTCVDGISTRKRGVGYLFQGLALFPHLTVKDNIAYGLRSSGLKKPAIHERVSKLMEMIRIDHLASRYPHMLSGGEQKRIALARSLAPSPQILLLDEPTSSLDNQTAKYLRNELIDVLKKLKITSVYVTHDLDEAYAIADRIAVMINGKIEQFGSKDEVFLKPKTEQAALYQGIKNIYRGKVTSVDKDKVTIENGNFRIIAFKENELHTGQDAGFCIRPQDIKIIKEDMSVRDELKDNLFDGEIVSQMFYSDYCIIKLKSVVDFEMKFPIYIYQRYNFHQGKKIRIGIWQKGISIFREESPV